MKLATRAYLITLILLAMALIVPAQKSDKDDRNTTSTVGIGGNPGGPTGLFTVYDGHTLRKGGFTLSLLTSRRYRSTSRLACTTGLSSFSEPRPIAVFT
jgi:hypothetical protein